MVRVAMPFLLGCAVGCDDSAGVAETDLVGTWEATAFKFSDFGDPVMDVDVIGMDGSVTMTVNADRTFTLTVTIVGPEVTNGTWELQGDDLLILTDSGEVDGSELTVSLSGTRLTVYSDDVEFDFGDGFLPAQLDAVFEKQ
jgi:hypothetical protein